MEARGIVLTPRGRDLYDRLVAEVDRGTAEAPGRARQEVAAEVWAAWLPDPERELARPDLAFSTSSPAERVPDGG